MCTPTLQLLLPPAHTPGGQGEGWAGPPGGGGVPPLGIPICGGLPKSGRNSPWKTRGKALWVPVPTVYTPPLQLLLLAALAYSLYPPLYSSYSRLPLSTAYILPL